MFIIIVSPPNLDPFGWWMVVGQVLGVAFPSGQYVCIIASRTTALFALTHTLRERELLSVQLRFSLSSNSAVYLLQLQAFVSCERCVSVHPEFYQCRLRNVPRDRHHPRRATNPLVYDGDGDAGLAPRTREHINFFSPTDQKPSEPLAGCLF